MNAIRSLSLLSALTAAALVASATSYAAPQDPLQPSAFPGHPANIVTQASAPAYKDSGNPLDPAFERAGNLTWVGTGKTASTPYRDTSNPLYPGYKR